MKVHLKHIKPRPLLESISSNDSMNINSCRVIPEVSMIKVSSVNIYINILINFVD